MLYCNRIDVSEAVDVNRTSASKYCIICHYCYFLDKGFRFQPTVCNVCHDYFRNFITILKFVNAIFYQIFIFSPNDSASKVIKSVFYFI